MSYTKTRSRSVCASSALCFGSESDLLVSYCTLAAAPADLPMHLTIQALTAYDR